MALFKNKWNIRFMDGRRIAMVISAVLIVASLGLLMTRGLNLGIDFTGGFQFQIEFPQATEVTDVRQALSEVGQSQAIIQSYSDNGMIIRLKADSEEVRRDVLKQLKSSFGEIQVLRLEKVGPVVGELLRNEAFMAVALALVGILIYITIRFRFRFAVVSVAALLHDTIITLGVFSLTGREISVTFIAAILTIVGYSLNDTIVVLDRIRENWKNRRSVGVLSLLDTSINQTLSRTINTSLTTFLPVLAFFLWGGPVIANFSFALLVGILVGTYSSIYVASSLLGEWYLRAPKES